MEQRRLIVVFIMMVASMFFEILGVGLVLPLIGLLADSNYLIKYPFLNEFFGFFGFVEHVEIVVFSMLLFLCFYILKALYITYYNIILYKFSFDVQANLSKRLFSRYLEQPYVFHLKYNSAVLLRNLTAEVDMFITNAIDPAMLIVGEFLIFLGICIFLLYAQPVGSLVSISIMSVVGYLFFKYTNSRVSIWAQQRQFHEGGKIKHLQQGLGGAKEVLLLGKKQYFLDEFNAHNIRYAHARKQQQIILSLPKVWLEVIAISGLTVLFVSMVLMNFETPVVLGFVALFAAAAIKLAPSFTRMIRATQTLRFGLPTIDLLSNEITNLVQHDSTLMDGVDVFSFRKDVVIDGVDYKYPSNDRLALKNVTLTLKKGEFIGIIGSSGAGKSTLIDVFLGLLHPSSGAVLVDGVNIKSNLRAWHRNIGYVPQSIYLTDDTLRKNIAFGLPDGEISDQSVLNAVHSSQLESFILELPDGLDSIIGERGARLSGGQRQRIGIARALYNDPEILVLDEATSSLDVETEAAVMKSIYNLAHNKTVIIISHRLSTVMNCDRVYKIEKGTVSAYGRPVDVI